jgi:hypothetical protein
LESYMESLREETRASHNKVDISGHLQLTLKAPGAPLAPPTKYIDNSKDFHEAALKFISISARFRPDSTESLCRYYIWLMNAPYPERSKRVFHRAFKARFSKSLDWFKDCQQLPMDLLQKLITPSPYTAHHRGNSDVGSHSSNHMKRKRNTSSTEHSRTPKRSPPASPMSSPAPRSPRSASRPQQGRKSLFDHATRAVTECYSVGDPSHRCRKGCPFLHFCTKCKKAGRQQASPPHTVGLCPHP